ncbi:MAG: hypothetical protein ABSD29_23700 [Verrucomicrobiota bacterium]
MNLTSLAAAQNNLRTALDLKTGSAGQPPAPPRLCPLGPFESA